VPSSHPHPNFHFAVDWGGASVAFEHVELPAMRASVIEYRDGSSPETQSRLLPGRVSYGRAILRRGLVPADNELFEWWRTIEVGTVQRRDVLVRLLDGQHQPVRVWRLRDAWPTALLFSPLDGRGNEIVLETLELAVESVDVDAP
jgi:phage tail-like protein